MTVGLKTIVSDPDIQTNFQKLDNLKADIKDNTPIASINMFAGSTAPNGWLLCDGTAINRITYARLFSVIGTTYGVGDGTTTFNLPDLRGRTPIGVGTGAGLTARALADEVGAETHQLTEAELAIHYHGITNGGAGAYFTGQDGADRANAWYQFGAKNTNNAGSNGAHNNMQPSIALNFIIKT